MRLARGWYTSVFLIIALVAQGVFVACSPPSPASGIEAPSSGISHLINVEHSDAHNQPDVPTHSHEPDICDTADPIVASLVSVSTYRNNDYLLVNDQVPIEVEHLQQVATSYTISSPTLTSSASTRRALLQVFLN